MIGIIVIACLFAYVVFGGWLAFKFFYLAEENNEPFDFVDFLMIAFCWPTYVEWIYHIDDDDDAGDSGE